MTGNSGKSAPQKHGKHAMPSRNLGRTVGRIACLCREGGEGLCRTARMQTNNDSYNALIYNRFRKGQKYV